MRREVGIQLPAEYLRSGEDGVCVWLPSVILVLLARRWNELRTVHTRSDGQDKLHLWTVHPMRVYAKCRLSYDWSFIPRLVCAGPHGGVVASLLPQAILFAPWWSKLRLRSTLEFEEAHHAAWAPRRN